MKSLKMTRHWPGGLQPLLTAILLATLHCVPQLALGQTLGSQNTLPLQHIYSAPASRVFDTNRRWDFRLQHALYNISMDDEASGDGRPESLLLDAEFQRSDISLTRQFRFANSAGFLTVALPWLSHSGGNSDSPIENWHDWFGLPNGNRDSRPQDEIRYLYQRNGETLVDIERSQSGVGDIELSWQQQYSIDSTTAMRFWRAGATLPTGDADELTGSDSVDVFVEAGVNSIRFARLPRLSWFASAGASYFADGGELESIREDYQLFGQAGLDWEFSERLSLLAQVESQSGLYDSDLKALEKAGLQLSMGLRQRFSQKWAASLFFTEDIDVSTAADFGLGLALQYTP